MPLALKHERATMAKVTLSKSLRCMIHTPSTSLPFFESNSEYRFRLQENRRENVQIE